MSDKKLGLKDTLRLAPKIALPKKEPNVEATDRMVQKLHEEEVVEPIVIAAVPQPIIEEMQPVTESRRITLDVPLDLYKQMKRRVFDDGVTLKKYILELVNHDLNP
jgi:predicted DNA binding CopG/RHH family protein